MNLPLLWNRVRYTLYRPFYDLVAALLRPYRRASLESVAPKPDERVLLIGAGTGLDLPYLRHLRHITAIDLTPAMVARLRRRAIDLDLPVEALVMDAQDLRFADASFDVVVLHIVLNVVPDPDACLAEAFRVLRPGGRFTLLDKFLPDARPPALWRRLLNPLARLVFSRISLPLPAMLEKLGQKADFRHMASILWLAQGTKAA